ncbi:hypothetical protein IJ541_10155 [bacterium]|nr:hypothetical protein [bacterium]
MAVLPISAASVQNSRINFTSKPNRNEEREYETPHKSNNLAKVPLITLLAMSPIVVNEMANAATLENYNGIEVVDNPEASEAGYLMSPQQSNPISEVVNPKFVQYKKRFRAEGKNYTMYYIDYTKPQGTKKVREIYFVPDDYQQTKIIRYNQEQTSPPALDHLIYHNIGEDKEFIGAYVYEVVGQNGTLKKRLREIRLPDEVANELTALGSNERDLTPPQNFKLTVVQTANLAPTKYEKMTGGTSY